ncbi:terminase small subunit [Janthinobacterium sp. PLB04]|uniref:Terminase small subunit n=2 Tax=Janthinobacterium lividum TaxID=29581 RepID=A0AAJ4MVG6_9BURK|nr:MULTISPECIES: terminase small subunit [Janthinobacterium]KAB0332358.1 terminase small subunit [Janthinobacterium lividum]QSX97966.1 terminase small subunit [Janthinobacterium lividum]UGQ37937.1 terminase small subunit [Janthinobacterium sp. PLB04]
MALTGKKRAFADAVLAGRTNKDAAIMAGYSPATASAAGSRLVKDPAVAEYLKAARASAVPGAPAVAPVAPPPRPTFDLNRALQHTDPKTFLMAAMNDIALGEKLRIDAAKALMPFVHKKPGEIGKKEEKLDAAQKAAGGRFGAPPPPPRLVSGGGK